jgi:RNA polymerase sigma-70 factor (ECF subfamily)
MQDEQKLISRCQNGEVQAFRELVERYEDRIYALACSIIGNPEAAKDLTQESFVRAYKALKRFEGKSSFYTWLYRISTNVCLNAAQKDQRRLDRVSLDGLQASHPISAERLFGTEEPENDMERIDFREQIDKVLNCLSPDHRAVVVLKDIEDLSQEEIADTLGVSVGTVKSRLSRARAHLREMLLALYTEWTGREPL